MCVCVCVQYMTRRVDTNVESKGCVAVEAERHCASVGRLGRRSSQRIRGRGGAKVGRDCFLVVLEKGSASFPQPWWDPCHAEMKGDRGLAGLLTGEARQRPTQAARQRESDREKERQADGEAGGRDKICERGRG